MHIVGHICLSVSPAVYKFQFKNPGRIFDKMLYVGNAIGGHSKLEVPNFVQSAVAMWLAHERLRWERH
jgi:hypothetical protein